MKKATFHIIFLPLVDIHFILRYITHSRGCLLCLMALSKEQKVERKDFSINNW